jgi:hypothetical protein
MTEERNGGEGVERDKARGGRASSPSVRLARTGQELLAGETVLGRAMVKSDYSPWTARNPTENGITVGRALQAAEAVFPTAMKTLKSIAPKALNVLDKAVTLNEGEEPDALQIQSAGLVTRLYHEYGSDDEGVEDAAQLQIWRLEFLEGYLQGLAHIVRVAARLGTTRTLELLEQRRAEVPMTAGAELDSEADPLLTRPTYERSVAARAGQHISNGDGHFAAVYRRERSRGFQLPIRPDRLRGLR